MVWNIKNASGIYRKPLSYELEHQREKPPGETIFCLSPFTEKTITMKHLLLLVTAFILTIPSARAQDKLPPLNQQILDYVTSVIGTQVDRGECWDLANQALILIDAKWDRNYEYGKELNPKKDKILPGDIIQFKNVKIRYQSGNTIFTETMDHHTAIVYRVLGKDVFELAHQNTGFSGRKVGLSNLDLNTVQSGKMWFYRPER